MKIKKPINPSVKNVYKGGVIITYGKKIYPNGDVYDGAISDGKKRDQYATMKYANGDYYQGPWVNDKKEGVDGKMTYSEGDDKFQFIGDWVDDKIHFGEMKYKDGSEYYGEWLNDLKNGKGEMKYSDGSDYYGEFLNDLKNGRGEMKYSEGDDKFQFIGDWVNDKIHFGEMKYKDGSDYYGEWLNDLKNGKGEMTYSDGAFYNGNWVNGVRHGEGEITYPDESIYDGNWVNDHRQGIGIFFGNDETQEGFWQEDRYLGPVRPRGLVLTDHDTDADYILLEDDNEEALQIHNASAKINLNKYLQIINVNMDSDYGNITDYVRSKFVPLINRLFSNRQQSIDKLNAVLEKLNLAEYSREPKSINIIGKTVDFVLKQPDEFIEFYINAFIQDCYNAYQDGQMSCVGGIVERFYMIIGDAAYAMCPDETCNNPSYTELLTLFGKKIDKNELTQKWAEEYLESEKIKKMSKSERKQHYIDFMKSKYQELDMLDETTENLINREADNLDYVFESLQLGGKKRNKQTRKNRKLTKKRFGKSKFRVRTIKVKKGKRRMTRKRPNKKIERIYKRS